MVERVYSTVRAHDEDDLAFDAGPYRAAALQPDRYTELFAGEPIHAPPRRRGSSMAGALAMVLALSTVAWGLYQTESWWRPWLGPALEAAYAAIDQALRASAPQAPTATLGTLGPSPLEPLASRQIEPAPGDAAGVSVPPTATAATHAPAPATHSIAPEDGDADKRARSLADEEQAAEPLPPPQIDPADPYQKRALAAGLHPQLSRALLSRLTETDYRNARAAIDKAVSTTPDGEKLTWPVQREPRHASFQVHFVPGAAPDCRRYVVTVTREGWSTTALPMERCGVKRQARAPS